MRALSRARVSAALLCVAALALVFGVVDLVTAPASQATAAFTKTVTVTRSHWDESGTKTTVTSDHVTLQVDQVTNLRGREEIGVSWSGAQPTGGVVGDVNSGAAASEEYPFVLLQCRGTATTVSPQTCWTESSGERFQSSPSNFPDWRADGYADPAQRSLIVGAPAKRPAACAPATGAEYWVPMKSAGGATYAGGIGGCAGVAPEASDADPGGLPSNTTYGVTGKDGTGSAQFDVWDADDNATLGCSSSVACSLVAIPVLGISCDAAATQAPSQAPPTQKAITNVEASCTAPPAYPAGAPATNGTPATLALTGSLWWAASNWHNRIVVPLSFAVSASVCSVVNSKAPVTMYGSVVLTDVTAQWEPTFCTDPRRYPFVHVQTADDSARGLLGAGSIDVALSTRAPDEPYGRPVVQAPVAMTGFAIAYDIDGDDGKPYTKLRLDARLVAKLLTESYPANNVVRDDYPALAKNPLNIARDPEFQALNPNIPTDVSTEAASTLQMLSSNADLVWALTSYLNEDPEARAWLDGRPDPWGMLVNPSYEGIELPVESWPLLDDFKLPASYTANACYSNSPAPYLGLVANPSTTMAKIVQDLQFSTSNVGTVCAYDGGDPTTLVLKTQGRQQPGQRFVLGVVPLTSVSRYDLTAAALQTSSNGKLSATFTDASGRTFVAPGSAGLKAASQLLTPDVKAGTWELPYDDLHTVAGQTAYPGTMPVYADVRTTGLSSATAGHIADFLQYAATTGQQQGTGNGQLAPGALPLTSADGAASLSGYTLCAAEAVRTQSGSVPALGTVCKVPVAGSSSAPTKPAKVRKTPSAPASTPTAAVPAASVAPPSSVLAPPAAASAPAAAGSVAPQQAVTAAEIRTVGAYSPLGHYGLPVALIVGVLCALAGSVLRWGDVGWRLAATGVGALRRRRLLHGARRSGR